MKIKLLRNARVPELFSGQEGDERTVTEELGVVLIERGFAEEVKKVEKKEEKPLPTKK